MTLDMEDHRHTDSTLAILAALAGGLWSPLKSEGIMFWVPAHILTAFSLTVLYLLLAGIERRKGLARLAGSRRLWLVLA